MGTIADSICRYQSVIYKVTETFTLLGAESAFTLILCFKWRPTTQSVLLFCQVKYQCQTTAKLKKNSIHYIWWERKHITCIPNLIFISLFDLKNFKNFNNYKLLSALNIKRLTHGNSFSVCLHPSSIAGSSGFSPNPPLVPVPPGHAHSRHLSPMPLMSSYNLAVIVCCLYYCRTNR